jgi:hypothetical protein
MNKFKFKAEHYADAILFGAEFQPSITKFKITQDPELPDVYVTFESIMTLRSIKHGLLLFDELFDMHVIFDTINHEENYTGEMSYGGIEPNKFFQEEMKDILGKKKRLDARYNTIKSQFIETCKPCKRGRKVSIVLSSGRKVEGSAQSFGILSDGNVCVTSYKEGYITRFITTPYQSIELL